MKNLVLLLPFCLMVLATTTAEERKLKEFHFTGSGYALGLQHGKALKEDIANIVSAWKANTSKGLEKDADIVIQEFFEYANFKPAIQKYTPELWDEVRGIADGSGQPFEDIYVLNLLDEFWVWVNQLKNHHCSGMGVPAMGETPGFIAQNMDLENYTDGFQVLIHLDKSESRPAQLILTHAGLIALNGMNSEGIGICVNTIMQLKASNEGLPVAFVVRNIINSTHKEELLDFIQHVKHASGQNYLMGIDGEIFDFEASSNKVVRFNPENENGTVYHTNHPVVNDDVKPWFSKYAPDKAKDSKPYQTNSYLRFASLESRVADAKIVEESTIKATLRSKDNADNPVCRNNLQNGSGFTFASIIMVMDKTPYILLVAGPPDEAAYKRYDFSIAK